MLDFPLAGTHISPLEEAVRLISRFVEPSGVYGLSGSASSFLIAKSARESSETIVVLTPNSEAASSCASDVRFYLGQTGSMDHPLEDPVLHYQSPDVMPFSFNSFDTEASLNNASVLYRISELRAPKVLVVAMDACAQKVVPKSELQRAGFSLCIGDEIDRSTLLKRLIAAGYRRSPLVEEPGDFSVRGFIVDMFSPVYPSPLRIEQMGDNIESIRFFDPATQRSKEEILSIHLSPVHMHIPDQSSLERGLRDLRHVCDERGIEKKIRQKLIDDFRHGIRFPGSEFYLPYFFSRLQTILDYIPKNSTLIIPDWDTISRAYDQLEHDILRGWESATEASLPVPAPAEVYFLCQDLMNRLQDFRTVIMSPLQMEEQGRTGIRIACQSNADVRQKLVQGTSHDSGMSSLVSSLERWRNDGCEVFIVCRAQSQATRFLKLMEPYNLRIDVRGEGFEPSNLINDPTPGIRLIVGELSSGFRIEEAHRIVLTEEEIFGTRVRRGRFIRTRGGMISALNDLVEGEAVVHEDYGIGIFRGLTTKEFDGVAGEVMLIEYAGGDLLYHPVERLQAIQKFFSGNEDPPRIDRLGGKGWAKTKAKVKKSIQEMAKELLAIYAKRHVSSRQPYSPPDENLAAFEAAFDFEETPDQAKAIQDIMEGMSSNKPMDRLVCGDVGYGKTEVALRAAFRSVMDAKQVAILVPTTVLAQQHFNTVTKRFNGYPIQVDMLSRFRTAAEQKQVIKRLSEGKVDLIIGTHRLLSKDVTFSDLGVLIVDEEHRFGVTHKEKIKKFKTQVDVITLTATPIPRTLQFSLTGIRDLSVIETPPSNRKSVRTYVMRKSEEVIRDALTRELNRGGQVFYIHNRVQTIHQRAAALQRLVPEGSFAVAHGQMPERELERVMCDFVLGKYNVLVCTSIIESGLDIPRANTIVIERADTFGLADLYQLRGRVGRSNVRAYAYLLTPDETLLTSDAIKRLAVIQEHSDLGQGFRIAMRDLEIRGGGNILGSAQSGHVALVGYEMYLELLEEAIRQIKGEETAPKIDPDIHLKIEILVPDEYVPDPRQRMNLYKRLSRATSNDEIDDIQDEILDRYGKAPEQVSRLISLMRLRLAMKELRITRMDYNGDDLVLSINEDTPIHGEDLIMWAHSNLENFRFLPGDRVAWRIGESDADTRIKRSVQLMESLANLSAPKKSTASVYS